MPYAHPPTSSAVASVTSGADQQRRRFRRRVQPGVYRRYASGMGNHLASQQGRMIIAHSAFEPCARTMSHTIRSAKPLSSRRFLGWVQCEGGPIEEIRPGDVVWFPPGEKHWHGATATTAITHIAITDRSTVLDRNGRSITPHQLLRSEEGIAIRRHHVVCKARFDSPTV
jgi:hypothetical protein